MAMNTGTRRRSLLWAAAGLGAAVWLLLLGRILVDLPSGLLTLGLYLGATALVIGASVAQRRRDLLQWLYYQRVPVGIAALIAAFPVAAATGAEALLGSMLVQDWPAAFVTTVLAFLALEVAKRSALIIHLGGELRFGYLSHDPKRGRWPGGLGRFFEDWNGSRLGLLFPVIFSSPLSVCLVLRADDRPSVLGGVLAGIAVSLLLIVLYAKLAALLVPRARRRVQDLVGGGDKGLALARRLRDAGYGGTWSLGETVLLAAISIAVYFLCWAWFAPSGFGPDSGSISPLGYLLLSLLPLGWALSTITYFLDRYRVSFLAALAVLFILFSAAWERDHYFSTKPPVGDPRGRITADPLQAARRRFPARTRQGGAGCPAGRPIVVVTASGGGIRASMWTARVLTWLQDRLGDDFARCVGAVSSVSGGSVGAMYYVSAYGEREPPRNGDDIVRAAGESSLGVAAWGLVYPDFVRAVTGLLPLDERVDRAWAIEQRWCQQLRAVAGGTISDHDKEKRGWNCTRTPTLEHWRASVARGRRPAQVFNVTEVETGRLRTLSPVDVGDRLDYNVNLVTAARLSATFPYVTPIARALDLDGEPAGNHFADGGYYDNFGTVSALDWIDAVHCEGRAGGSPGKCLDRKVLIVQINASSAPEREPAAVAGWLAALAGPLLSLVNVMDGSQQGRDRLELDLASRMGRDGWLESFRFAFDYGRFAIDDDGRCVELPEGPPRRKAPLSWELTATQKLGIRSAICSPDNRNELERLERAFAADGEAAPPRKEELR